MPSKILSTLNTMIRADLTAAEINAAPRKFVAYSLPRLGGQRINLSGLVYSAVVSTADRPNAILVLALQRGLIITQATDLQAEEKYEQMIFQYFCDLRVNAQPEPWFPAKPLPLEPGDSYVLYMSLAAGAAFANQVNLSMTVFGSAEPVSVSDDMIL